VLDQWLNSEHFDSTLGSELQGFLRRDVRGDPGFHNSPQVERMLGKLSSLGDLIGSMVRCFHRFQVTVFTLKRLCPVICVTEKYFPIERWAKGAQSGILRQNEGQRPGGACIVLGGDGN